VLTMEENSLELLSDCYGNPMTMPLYSQVPKNVRENLRYRQRVLRAGYNSRAAARELWIACKRDPFFWINTFAWTYNPRMIPKSTTRPMVTYGFQDNALWEMFGAVINQYDLHIEKSREMTATWNLLLVFTWFAQFQPGLAFRLVSRNADLVDSREDPDALFCKIDFILQHQPSWLLNENQYNRTYMHLFFYETDSTIDGSSTTSDTARAGRCTSLGLDEFASAPDGYAMLRATRDVTGCRMYNSTPKGTGNAFYDLKKKKIKHLRLHWSEHPVKRRGLYRSEDGKLVLLDKEYHGIVRDSEGNGTIFPDNYKFRLDGKLRSPWYDTECDRAAHPMEISQELDIDYLGSDYQFFDARVIDRIQEENVREPVVKGELEFDFETCEPTRFIPCADGRLHLWVNLTPEGEFPDNIKVVQGSDASAGTGASNSVMSFVNKETGEKIGEFAEPKLYPEDFAVYAVAMAKWFNNAYMIWDASGPCGRVFGSTVMDLGYMYIWWKTAINKFTRKSTDIPGFFMNPGDKADAFGKYRRALKDGTFIQRSYEANKECLFFRHMPGTQAIEHTAAATSIDPSGARTNHGDRCTADVVANFAMHTLKDKSKKPIVEEKLLNCYKSRRDQYEAKLREKDEVWA